MDLWPFSRATRDLLSATICAALFDFELSAFSAQSVAPSFAALFSGCLLVLQSTINPSF